MPNIEAMRGGQWHRLHGSGSCDPTRARSSARRSGLPTARATTCAGSTTAPRSRAPAAGTYVSCVAETADGELLCHEGMSLAAAGDAVALRPGGDDAGGPRPASLHQDQALPDGLGPANRAWRACSARRPLPTPTARRPTSSWRPRDRLPPRLDPGYGLQRRRRSRPGRSANRRPSSIRSSTTATSGPSTRPPATTRSSAGRWSSASCAARLPSRRPTASSPSDPSSTSTSTPTTTSP